MNQKYALRYETLLEMNGQPVFIPFLPFVRPEAWRLVSTDGEKLFLMGIKDTVEITRETYGINNFFAFREMYQTWNRAAFHVPETGRTVQVIQDGKAVSATYMETCWFDFDGEVIPASEKLYWKPFDRPLPLVYGERRPNYTHVPAQIGLDTDALRTFDGSPVLVMPNRLHNEKIWSLVGILDDGRVFLSNTRYTLDASEGTLYGTEFIAVDRDISEWHDLGHKSPHAGERVQVCHGQKTCCMEYQGKYWLEHFSHTKHDTGKLRFWKPVADPSPLLFHLI